MKNLKTYIISILALLVCQMAAAYDFIVDDICYKYVSKTDKTVAVTYRYKNLTTDPDSYTATTITIPETVIYDNIEYIVTEIGYQAFYNCSKVKNVNIGNNVTTIGKHAFISSGVSNVQFGNNVTTIGEKAFCLCSRLSNITIGNSVTTIGDRAFSLSGLTNITIPNSVITIGFGAFEECGKLKEVILGSSVKEIGDQAFDDCYALEKVEWGDSLETIGKYAFYRCYALTTAILPNTLKEIGFGAFYESGVVDVVIPDSCTTIGDRAFMGSKVQNISIGSGVTTIGGDPFYYAPLKNVTCFATTPPVVSNVNYYYLNPPSDAILYVPYGTKELYANAFYWKLFNTIVEVPFGYELTITEAQAATLCLPYKSVIPEGAYVFALKGVDENGVIITERLKGTIPANSPVLVKGGEGVYTFVPCAGCEKSDDLTNGLLTATYESEIVVPQGSYILSFKGNKLHFRKSNGKNQKIRAYHAYLTLPAASEAKVLTFDFDGDGSTTDLPVVSEEQQNNDAPIYNLAGQRVRSTAKGLLIRGGKKYIAK